MKKKPGPFALRCQYLAVRIFAGLLYLLPLPLAVLTAKGIALLFHALDRRHRLLCREALQQALHLDAQAAAAMTRKATMTIWPG